MLVRKWLIAGICEGHVLNVGVLVKWANMFRNRHWHAELHDNIINLSWHPNGLDQAIATPFATAILDNWLLKELDHVVSTLRMALQHFKKIWKRFCTPFVQLNIFKRGADSPQIV